MPRRTIFGFLLLFLMLFSLAAVAQRTPVRQGEPYVPRDAQGRPISEVAAAQRRAQITNPQTPEQDEAWVDQEMYKIRRDLVRDSINRMRSGTDYRDSRPVINEILGFTGPFLIFLVIVGFLLWFIKTLVENRRWDKMARIQTDAHTKVLDKLGASQELLAYIESDAGKKFLEATPFAVEHERRPSFQFSRVLWSAQAGVVATVVGVGFLWLVGRFTDQDHDARGLLVLGTICMALGIGLLISAALSFVLSKRFGLLDARPADDRTEVMAHRPQ